MFLLVSALRRFLGIAPADWKMRKKMISLKMKKMIKMMKEKARGRDAPRVEDDP
ncbi:hypothetical protein [Bradyrhizobium retamae]|uniref:hypothetical protein n=1 Tax=Bradyrhizobium retamae TaxID=1300035 RepID=UPI0012E3C0E3|nr:hypothetical protein [Bradyrhizobium retamae]